MRLAHQQLKMIINFDDLEEKEILLNLIRKNFDINYEVTEKK